MITTTINRNKVKISGERPRKALASHLFRNWASQIDPYFTVRSIKFQSVDVIRGAIKFIKLKAYVTDGDGRSFSSVVFLRGGSVAILVILNCEGELYTVLVSQRRFAVGKPNLLEIPAGTIEAGSSSWNNALRELREELGIAESEMDRSSAGTLRVRDEDATAGLYPSPGACDEYIELYFYEVKITRKGLDSFQGKQTGLAAENEHITLSVVPLDDLPKLVNDGKSLAAYYMYKRRIRAKRELFSRERSA
ncbi:MAG: NUDIX domain-containing protein [Patescibacteria group bacterium]|nr:NUDIX domain-containing protein [Patescibacteria group bacterium]MDE2116877.1 NUDIX domain-containing protein [Patescibacteria group bacterium]